MASANMRKMQAVPEQAVGYVKEELPVDAKTMFNKVREVQEVLSSALNNLAGIKYRLRPEPEQTSKDGPSVSESGLDEMLADCNYLARRVLGVSQELSGIVGE